METYLGSGSVLLAKTGAAFFDLLSIITGRNFLKSHRIKNCCRDSFLVDLGRVIYKSRFERYPGGNDYSSQMPEDNICCAGDV